MATALPAPTTTTREFIKVLADIIQTELDLEDEQVMLYNENQKIPEGTGIFIVLAYAGAAKTMANNNEILVDEDTGVVTENQCINVLENISVDILSRDSSARLRKEEIILAFNSVYSKQQQELYQFKIFVQTINFIDVSELEGSSRLNRYQALFNVMTSYRKSKEIDYYNQFDYNLLNN